PIRDETLREGLVAVGAGLRREDLPTTSASPRYALKAEFSELFEPALEGTKLENAISRLSGEAFNKKRSRPYLDHKGWRAEELSRNACDFPKWRAAPACTGTELDHFEGGYRGFLEAFSGASSHSLAE